MSDYLEDAMKKTTFTDTMIRKLKPTESDYTRSEGNGFTIRVMPSGSKTWLYLYAFDGKRRKMNLGSYPDVTLETARGRFEDAKRKVKNNIDPMAEAEEQAEERRKAPTVADLVHDYIERHAKRFKRSWAKDEQILNREVVPAWGKRKAADVTKRDILRLLEEIVNRNAPAMANNTFQIIRKMFNWAVEQDILQHTPCTGVKLPSPKLSRDRVLSESEIKTLWENLGRPDAGMSDGVRRALRLILTTAQRPGEVTGLHTSELDGCWWTIPAERAKNGKTHRVYLSGLALEIINQAIAQAKKSRETPYDQEYNGYVFPCHHKSKEKPMGDTALAVAVGRALASPLTDDKGNPLFTAAGKPATENRLGIDHFTPHDLRRTTATFMASMGFMDEVIDAVLNHAKQGVIKVYNQYRYDVEKQQALETWENKLKTILAGDKVVDLDQKRKERNVA
ncbi:phage integrase family protein [Pelobacter propionicus DSM 2379]|uniref:Phage integrase family protein n=2 Tax=Pelobacter propionicus TaxID=29543 RepID=A1ATP4_PELPD|nr:phage integrase family protein [Pelobacter propionicus DSM 2379]